ncbi:MAG: DUF4209 domain-containing protein [Flavobacteriales bacterium]|nr:DUF4209 domain-containing protein [Flavobacteriales bacterium]
MSELQDFIVELDSSDWDAKNEHDLNRRFQEVTQVLVEKGNDSDAEIANKERGIFAFRKSVENGTVAPQMEGTGKNKEGQEVAIVWPDIRDYSEKDFDYFKKRFNATKNIYAKCEYGLFLLLVSAEQHNEFKEKLIDTLLVLSKTYYKKGLDPENKEHYSLYFIPVIRNALLIAVKSRLDKSINPICQYIYESHLNWDIKHSSTLRILLDITNIISSHLEHFAKFDISKILTQNWDGAKELATTYAFGAIHIAEGANKLAHKIENTDFEWKRFIAEQYEKLGEEAAGDRNLAAISFVEKALRLYKELKDKGNIQRLEKWYGEVRGAFKLGEIKKDLSKEDSKRISEDILKSIAESDEEGIMKTICLTPMITSLVEIEKWSEDLSKDSFVMSMFPTSIIDKFGNTVDVYVNEEEKKEYALLQTFGFHFQIASQILTQYILEAFKAQKLSVESTMKFLSNSWMAQALQRAYNGEPYEATPLDTIKPAIILLFSELEKWKEDSDYTPELIIVTDSLILKLEYVLRCFCEKIGIATFRPRQKGSHKIMMEKTLDILLSDLRGDNLREDDRFLLKFVLTEKAGLNLRNKIAHGLMDANEYNLNNVFLALTLILKLSAYKFVRREKDL